VNDLNPPVFMHHVREGEAVVRSDQDDRIGFGSVAGFTVCEFKEFNRLGLVWVLRGIYLACARVPIMLRVPRNCRLSA
jgi:hypothetical protein